uniref:CCHC-type domain-containing protein n=1 Tax=Leptobrachium leishanense TaxID=445787 RepID=A0A8C5MHV4_9ANUR
IKYIIYKIHNSAGVYLFPSAVRLTQGLSSDSSGRNVPTLAGEETFEEWVEQAMQALDEWDVPEAQKKQRITESLKGPASEAVRILKLSKQDCTALDYLNMLQEVFGSSPKRLKSQANREKKNLYMACKNAHLIPLPSKALMDQIFKGALPLDPIMLRFQTRYQNMGLTYSKLIKAIREEEALIKAKMVANASPTAFTAEVGTLCVADIQTEVLALKTQMLQMMELMTLLSAKDTRTEGVAVASNRGSPSEPPERNKLTHPGKKCFGCGEIGHFRAQCPQGRAEKKPVEELLKAVEKLLSVLQAGNARVHQ